MIGLRAGEQVRDMTSLSDTIHQLGLLFYTVVECVCVWSVNLIDGRNAVDRPGHPRRRFLVAS